MDMCYMRGCQPAVHAGSAHSALDIFPSHQFFFFFSEGGVIKGLDLLMFAFAVQNLIRLV